jgi:hypothetical protein
LVALDRGSWGGVFDDGVDVEVVAVVFVVLVTLAVLVTCRVELLATVCGL